MPRVRAHPVDGRWGYSANHRTRTMIGSSGSLILGARPTVKAEAACVSPWTRRVNCRARRTDLDSIFGVVTRTEPIDYDHRLVTNDPGVVTARQ